MTKSEETAFGEGLKGTAVLRSGGGEPVVAAERASDARIPPGSGYQLRTVPVATLPGGQVQVITTGTNPDETLQVDFALSASGFYISSNNYPSIVPILILFGFYHEPSGPVYPMLIDPQQVLDDRYGPVTASRQPGGTYLMYLIPKWQSVFGEYSGNLELKLCKDARCTSEYKITGGALPYKFEFRPDVTLTAKLNGTPVTDLRGFTKVTSGQTMEFLAPTGATVEIESNMPVTWTVGGVGTSRTLAVVSQTDRRVVGTVTGGTLTGSIDVRAQPIDTRYKYYSTVSIPAL
ncbi:hypothetical protein [Variovorax sp. MHTC-1]|uniref:hypothetical protein n=1 Tax=Variovorax sp. MHTC-1 TaxID=2495593 RepID=UPI000F8961FB|nr:hypothetical protein [Variovorax sp. MHTC-1]RST52779.1 hypothetical protein EJI01_16410 [Variovorax sp. MHTC-1]